MKNLSVYNGVKDTVGVSVSMDSVIDRIRSGAKGLAGKTKRLNQLYAAGSDDYDVEKVLLPAVTWAGQFLRRNTESLESHSGYVVLDVDNDVDVAEVQTKLGIHPNVAVLFTSPSGHGVKPVVPVSPVPFTVEEHHAAFDAVLEVFREFVADDPVKLPAQRDPTRLCFLAHDENVVDNREKAQPVTWSLTTEVPLPDESSPPESKPPEQKSYDPPTESQAREVLRFISPDVPYNTWKDIGMGIKDAGLPVSIWDDWSKGGREYKPGECEKKWESFKKSGIGWGTVVNLAKEGGYGKSKLVPSSAPGESGGDLDLSPLPVEAVSVPSFPDYEGELFLGAFQALYQAYSDTHVWSPEMLMAMGIGAYSFIAKSARVRTHERANSMALNSFILAVGESDLTAKSEALSEIKKVMYAVDHDFDPVSNVQSIEGLLTALNDNDSPERYCLFDEGSVVFENARRQGTKNLFAGLNELWLCPPSYSTARAAGTNKVVNPYVCCWANIPTKLIASVFRHEDMIGGSLNRWLPFYIQPKEKTERYPHAVGRPYDVWIKEMCRAVDSSNDRMFTFTEEADDARFGWFEGLRSKAIAEGEQIGESRFHTHAVKLAGIFALAENPSVDNFVQLHHWDAALTVVRYLSECSEYLFRNVGASRIGELENEVLDVLALHDNEMSLSELTKKTRRFDSDERARLLDLLETNRLIVRFNEQTKGRPKVIVRRVS